LGPREAGFGLIRDSFPAAMSQDAVAQTMVLIVDHGDDQESAASEST
jgi:hypothetical protein